MSRQSKNAKRLAKAREITALHAAGGKGPARTTPQHGKRWTYRSNPALIKARAELIKTAGAAKQEKTSGRAILENAGAASAED